MYNTDIRVEYDDDEGYRRCILAVFSIDIDPQLLDVVDPFEVIQKECDDIIAQTGHYQELNQVYKDIAMQHLLCEDRAIGLCLLFSYENFQTFHNFLAQFLPLCGVDGEEKIPSNSKVKEELIQLLRTKLFETKE